MVLNVGVVEVSEKAKEVLESAGLAAETFISRHQSGDWGDISKEHRQANEIGLLPDQKRWITSRYKLWNGQAVTVTTSQQEKLTWVKLEDEEFYQEVSSLEGYQKWAENYDLEHNPLIALEEPVVKKILGKMTFRRALDIGTGTGRWAVELARMGAEVTGIDQSPEMLKIAEETAREKGLDIHFYVMDAQKGLDLPDEQFDLVTCALMLGHVPKLRPVFEACYRVLQPGGYLILSMFHPDGVAYGMRTHIVVDEVNYLLPNMPHSLFDYCHHLKSTGFEIIKKVEKTFEDLPSGYIPDDVLENFAEIPFCLVLVARKGKCAS